MQTDSAYVSNSASGIGSGSGGPSSAHPSHFSGKSGGSRDGVGNSLANDSGIGKGSISGIGKGSISGSSTKFPGFISEKAKMKLVVRRLEHLFTGRESRGQLALSQQRAVLPNLQVVDEALEEGAREASMMDVRPNPSVSGPTKEEMIRSTSDSGLDQRPTRPFDLDPRRAQIPEQNLEYLHHLTSSYGASEPLASDRTWDGWVYLNLITNLAQLHTINVTLPFVKKSIATMSTKLELSPDGKMVRWRGGTEGSNLSSESGSGSRSEGDSNSPSGESPLELDGNLGGSRGRKRADGKGESVSAGNLQLPKDLQSSTIRLSSNSRSAPKSGQRSGGTSHGSSDFHYKPLFALPKSFQDDSSDRETLSSLSSVMKGGSSPEDGQGTRQVGSGEVSGDRGRRSKRSIFGPIIYYENGNFCTDLSAQELIGDESATPEYPYERMTNEVVGAPPGINNSERRLRPLTESPILDRIGKGKGVDRDLHGDCDGEDSGEVEDEEDEIDTEGMIHFSPRLNSTLPDHPPLPVELEASGLGGVLPEDNFAINVQVKHYILPKGKHTHTINPRKLKSKIRGIAHRIPQSSIDVFHKDEGGTNSSRRSSANFGSRSTSSPQTSSFMAEDLPPPKPLRHELVSTRFIRLPPSSLPPASFMFFSPSSDDSSRDSDSGLVPMSTGSDYYMDSRLTDGSTDEGQDIKMLGVKGKSHGSSRRTLMRSRGAGSSRIGGSMRSGKLVVGRQRSESMLPDSSAATAGSGGESIMGIDDDEQLPICGDSPPTDSGDSDEQMEDDLEDGEGKSMDSDDERSEEENDENDDQEGGSRLNRKRSRSSKCSVDSLLLARKSKNARMPDCHRGGNN